MIRGRRTAWASVIGQMTVATAAAAASATGQAQQDARRAGETTALDAAVRATVALPSFTMTESAGGSKGFQLVYEAPSSVSVTFGTAEALGDTRTIGEEQFLVNPCNTGQWLRHRVHVDLARNQAMGYLHALLVASLVRRSAHSFTLAWESPDSSEYARFVATVAGGHVVSEDVTVTVAKVKPAVETEHLTFSNLGSSPPVTAPPTDDVVEGVQHAWGWGPAGNEAPCQTPSAAR